MTILEIVKTRDELRNAQKIITLGKIMGDDAFVFKNPSDSWFGCVFKGETLDRHVNVFARGSLDHCIEVSGLLRSWNKCPICSAEGIHPDVPNPLCEECKFSFPKLEDPTDVEN